ncbi:bifunctional folylpolyglutamate synthase/dihydrofolate synthase [Xanthomarina sp. F1114]|uniref:bifunctional folylpolyglutamate synthase/dihydrofolate synthase n=1 Tax=Xanthomarina sp. F1114 TaxID=2996019 RepID=UPI00225E5ED4|nr:folylpolyglutamate synthase/dihydrofolate synthase family protein [Xanthomarina sp. F1114]MCX7548239.1 bifunctional folylpolyglutamate synthase/dihydrofolate synthase [Xanthomarina sp. F1114]
MTYQDTINWMFSQLPMYQKQGKSAYKADLKNTYLLAEHLNNPHNKFKTIHVAGTNGKGSTSHMLASVLQEAGYQVGLFTSPHLKDFRERIKINGVLVSQAFVIDFIKRNKAFLESESLSFFEMTSGMAFEYFAKQEVDIAVIEVGLGGRLDSTNIITPEVSVITNIGLDHTQFLGNSLELIAGEKAGIIKPGVPVVIGETQKETQQVFKAYAKKKCSEIYFADKLIQEVYSSDLKGHYQQKNIKTVLQTLQVLNQSYFKTSLNQITKGLLQVVENTGLQGRWHILQEYPKVICDTAHNKEGLKYVIAQLEEEIYNKLHIVFGVVNDKDLNSILDILPKNATYYFCKPDVPRGMDENLLQAAFLSVGLKGKSYLSVNEALKAAKSASNSKDLIYVGGSTFVVAEII